MGGITPLDLRSTAVESTPKELFERRQIAQPSMKINTIGRIRPTSGMAMPWPKSNAAMYAVSLLRQFSW